MEKEQAAKKLCETLLLRTKEECLNWYHLGHLDYLVIRFDRNWFPIVFRLCMFSAVGWILCRYRANGLGLTFS